MAQPSWRGCWPARRAGAVGRATARGRRAGAPGRAPPLPGPRARDLLRRGHGSPATPALLASEACGRSPSWPRRRASRSTRPARGATPAGWRSRKGASRRASASSRAPRGAPARPASPCTPRSRRRCSPTPTCSAGTRHAALAHVEEALRHLRPHRRGVVRRGAAPPPRRRAAAPGRAGDAARRGRVPAGAGDRTVAVGAAVRAARRARPRPAAARPGARGRGARAARAGLRLLHRGLRASPTWSRRGRCWRNSGRRRRMQRKGVRSRPGRAVVRIASASLFPAADRRCRSGAARGPRPAATPSEGCNARPMRRGQAPIAPFADVGRI